MKNKKQLILEKQEFLTIQIITEALNDYWEKNRIFPDEILLDIKNYFEYPALFIPNSNILNTNQKRKDIGNIKNGFYFSGIKIIPNEAILNGGGKKHK